MQEKSALARAMAMVADLRSRCDWDRVQTRTTLRPYLVEEALELDQALGRNDPASQDRVHASPHRHRHRLEITCLAKRKIRVVRRSPF
jgi:NTP pyrophosphatase (non-canonical NTP hydrolase)